MERDKAKSRTEAATALDRNERSMGHHGQSRRDPERIGRQLGAALAALAWFVTARGRSSRPRAGRLGQNCRSLDSRHPRRVSRKRIKG